MNAWEGQVIAIAVKELLEAVKTLGRDGFGHRDRTLLSGVIRDLLSVHPNVARTEATLKAIQAIGAPPSADLFMAMRMLDAVKKTRLLDTAADRASGTALTAPAPGQEGLRGMEHGHRNQMRSRSAAGSLHGSAARDRAETRTRRDNQ